MHRPLFATAALIAAAIAGQAAAHAHLLSSDPAANATVAATRTVTLHMSESLEPKFSGLELTRADGGAVAVKVAVPETDRKAIVAEAGAPLPPGDYKVSWHAVSTDGHRTQGVFGFKVR